jgi:autotransporter-associated beta strand protein
MKSLFLALLLLAPGSLVFGQANNPSPPKDRDSRQERMFGLLRSLDTNHDGQLDADEIQAAGRKGEMVRGIMQMTGLDEKYPVKISDLEEAMQKTRPGFNLPPSPEPQEAKKSFKTLKEILEALPRKPEKDDNFLASLEATEWIQQNALGSVIQITAKVSGFSTSRPSTLGRSPKRENYRVGIMLERQGLWEGIGFSLRVSGNILADENINNYYKIKDGDEATVEGKVTSAEINWGLGKGNINLSLTDCKLISVNKADAAVGFTKTGGGTLILSGSNTYTGTTNISGGTLVITDSNASTAETEAAKSRNEPTPAKSAGRKVAGVGSMPSFDGTGTITITGDAVRKPAKFWTCTTDSEEYAIRLDEVDYVLYRESQTTNPTSWHIAIHLKTQNQPISLIFNDAEKAHAVYQNLLQALESGSEKIIEVIGKNPEAGLRGTVRMQNAPVEKRKPPEEKKEKSLFD